MGKRKLEEVDGDGDDSSQIESDDSCSSSNSITTNSSTDVPSGISGLQRSGKNIWKMNFFPGQGKVREFCGWSGKFRKDLESQGI